ncbi:MAG: hypothetical protein JJU41_06550 [Bacteroidetes bacterium]|nr:hypothetical protein [Bacteroidota bacterium]MCH8524024.1 hypothetical protein [Balneolales bacterium]
MAKWYIISAVIGASAGFAYYYYIGCVTGTCPIQTNPWLSTSFGTLFGVTLLPDVFSKFLDKKQPETPVDTQ